MFVESGFMFLVYFVKKISWFMVVLWELFFENNSKLGILIALDLGEQCPWQLTYFIEWETNIEVNCCFPIDIIFQD